ncbi:hypothetical protein [Mycobacterium sp.]|uniref:hypothetical protein n=1 Tax=Mycobacterium sp. TaxID=1785 RepID=UPI003F94B471
MRVAQVEHKIISAEYDDMPVTYEVQTAHALGGPAPYDVMWAWLSGFHNGIEETLRKEGQKQ